MTWKTWTKLLPLAMLLAVPLGVAPAPAQPAPDATLDAKHIDAKTGKPFKLGAKPTPRHKLMSAPRHRVTGPTLTQVAYVPKQLSFWLNNQEGDCVTASEAFKCACQNPEIFITDSTVGAWASQYGFANGAGLTEVMDQMARDGFHQGGSVYGDGHYTTVDYSNEAALQNALSYGPVKIGIDHAALPSGAGNQNGWFSLGGRQQHRNEDHCVELAGFGPASFLFTSLNVPLPGQLKPDQTGYLLFTWNTIGFVDHPWIMSTVGEAWLRNPGTTVNGTPQPNPGPGPNPEPPVPPVPPAPPVPPGGESLFSLLHLAIATLGLVVGAIIGWVARSKPITITI